MSEQKVYNPREHLVKIKSKDGSLKDYYPAPYRLYELTLRYSNANFSSEIIHMDVERNLVVVKCRLYLGAHFEQSEKKTEAMKSGLLSALDKVETAAKARCARDFGISTELALETDLESEIEQSDVPPAASNGREAIRERLNALYARALNVKLCGSRTAFLAYISKLMQVAHLTAQEVTMAHLDAVEREIVAGEAVQPAVA